MTSAILLIHCIDQKGLLAAITHFIGRHNGNILSIEQHVDTEQGMFFMRAEWDLQQFALARTEIEPLFKQEIGDRFKMAFSIHFLPEKQRMALFVSKLPHCFYDILARCHSGEWPVDIPLIISNHKDMAPVAEKFGVDYHYLPINADNKRQQEARQLALLQRHHIDFIVLARYMQIMTDDVIQCYENRILNIHHSFLPAFPGAKPYHAAHQRGVKIIGATSHYVTAELDAGPIIEQEVVHVSHADAVADFIREGRNLEKIVLARAVWKHMQRKILVDANRTVVFD